MARRNLSLVAGGAIVATLALAAAFGPLLVRADPLAIDLTQVLAPPGRGHGSDATRSAATCWRACCGERGSR